VKKIIIVLLAVLLIGVTGLVAKPFGKTGTAALQFLKIGIDARATGMGEAYTAVTDDISSVWWNPAGLSPALQQQAFFSHTNWPADIMHEFAAASYTNGVSTWALSASVLHMDQMKVTDAETFGYTGETFTNSDMAFGITYASTLTDKFSFGMTGKYLRENLYIYSINSFSIDLGSMYNTGWKNVKIGMALRNFGPDVRFKVDDDDDGSYNEDPFDLLDNDGDGLKDEDGEEIENKIPLNFSLGICGDLMRNNTNYWIASFQLDNCIDRMETWNVGTEYKLGNLFLRGGYQFNYDSNNMSAGFGVQIPTRHYVFNVDYAYTDMGKLEEDFFNSAHRLSIKLKY
jgi:hypothetical protein